MALTPVMIFLEEEQLASSVAAVIKLHECLLSRASKVLEAKLAYLDNSREVDEWVEAAEVWIAAKSRETLSCLEHHPLKSSAIKSQIMQVQSGLCNIKVYFTPGSHNKTVYCNLTTSLCV